MKEVLDAISNDQSRLVGQGEWEKDSCYQVHEVEGKFYAIIVCEQDSMWLMDDTLEEIKEEEIVQYV
jgi:hypothetical protein